jgi:16S rRNA processing protein RimM
VVAGAWDDLVLVGVVARTHGHRGAVIVNPETDFPEERFRAGATVWMRRGGLVTPVAIREAWFHQGRPVLTFEGVVSMTDAEPLRGAELRVPEDALHPLPEGSYYQFRLVGCVVVTVDGEPVGEVRAVEGDAGGQRLVVDAPAGEVLVPFVAPICTSIDVDGRRIVIDPPDGLLDVNRRSGTS